MWDKGWFQSLIGSLKTEYGLTNIVVSDGFQSLIGSLKTTKTAKSSHTEKKFQSLIGSLKTGLLGCIIIPK